MILDVKRNAARYKGLHENLDKAIDYLLHADLDALSVGKHVIEGEAVFVLIQAYDTKEIQGALFEAHKKYVDIQLILSGNEWIGYAPVESLVSTSPYDEDRDIEFLSGDGEIHKLHPGMFSIYFPTDAHMPSIHETKTAVKKAVFKIRL